MTADADLGTLLDHAATVRQLIEKCRDGSFYEDYDASTTLLGLADEALSTLVLAGDQQAETIARLRETVSTLKRFAMWSVGDVPPNDGSRA